MKFPLKSLAPPQAPNSASKQKAEAPPLPRAKKGRPSLPMKEMKGLLSLMGK